MTGVDAQRYLDLPLPDPDIPVDAITMTRDPDRSRLRPRRERAAVRRPARLARRGRRHPGPAVLGPVRRHLPDQRDRLAAPDRRRLVAAAGARPARSATATSRVTSPKGRSRPATATWPRPGDPPRTARSSRCSSTRSGRSARSRSRSTRPPRSHGPRWCGSARAPAPSTCPWTTEGRGELPRPWTFSAFSVQILQSETAFSIQGQEFVPLDPGISDIKLDGRSLKPHPAHLRAFPCGSGPDLQIGGRVVQTSFRASTLGLIRGRSVPFEACGSDEIALGSAATEVLAEPTSLFRVDSLSLIRVSAEPSVVAALDVRRDPDGLPASVDLPTRSGPSVLVLPQNVNEGWVATADGRELKAQRVDGWKQGWLVPGGEPVTVTLRLPARGDLPPRPRRRCARAPALRRGRRAPATPGPREDTAAGAGPGSGRAPRRGGGAHRRWAARGLVRPRCGRRRAGRRGRRTPVRGLGRPAAAAMLLVGAGLSWDRITQESWANDWRQAWSLVVVGCVVAALVSGRRGRPETREAEETRERSPGSAPAPADEDAAPSARRTAGS